MCFSVKSVKFHGAQKPLLKGDVLAATALFSLAKLNAFGGESCVQVGF